MAHALARRRRDARDEADDGLLHVVLDPLSGVRFVRAADFADHHDGIRVRIVVEHLHHVDVLQTVDRIAADADRRRLAEAERRQLRDGFIRQRARARHDADTALAVDVARHDADLQFVRRDRARAVRPEQQRLAAFAAHAVLHFDHVANGNAFRDADREIEIGFDRFPDRRGGARRRHVDDRHGRAGFRLRFLDARVDRNAFEIIAGLLRVHARDERFAAVCIFTAGARVELAGLAGDALRDDLRVFVDQNRHVMTSVRSASREKPRRHACSMLRSEKRGAAPSLPAPLRGPGAKRRARALLLARSRGDDLLRRFFHAVRRDDRQAGFRKHLLAEVFVRALHAHDERHVQIHGLRARDHAFRDHVAAHDAAEDVHEDRLQARVLQHQLERFGDLLGRRAAADVEEVRRLAAEQLDRIHRRHRQARAVHEAADVAVERDVREVELRRFDFSRIFFVQIAVRDDFRMAEQRVRIEVELRVERDHLAVARQHERVDFGERRVRFPERLVQALQDFARLRDRCVRHADLLREIVGFGILQAHRRLDSDLVDRFRRLFRDFLDVHAAFARRHHDDLLRHAIDHDADIQFLLDVRAFFDQQTVDLLAFRARLVRLQLHAEDLVRVFAHLLERLRDLHAAALAAAARMNLGLDDPDRAAQLLRHLDGLVHRERRLAARYRDSEFPQDFLTLVLVNLHA
ncbi:hypothetical protein BURPS1710b_0976 [Burkholderia pseudomallei 1710b]|uniref:Uncharacterized protein n=1 Tax=Burkholderia pseudomallei (strain 1710b) TaxID=320372 RepID=Q3JVL6_BURP1|nr:hypothetical protein BURPS1710b_0976 [Burkholderia pseudomallei 1710b]